MTVRRLTRKGPHLRIRRPAPLRRGMFRARGHREPAGTRSYGRAQAHNMLIRAHRASSEGGSATHAGR